MEYRADFSQGIWNWYGFQAGARVLYLSCHSEEKEAVSQMLFAKELQMDMAFLRQPDAMEYAEAAYQYVLISSEVLERSANPVFLLQKAYQALNTDGTLLLAAYNRLGIRFFCGDRDPFTNHSFDCVENYRRLTHKDLQDFGGRLYGKEEIGGFLSEAGFLNRRFYAVFPDLQMPQVIYAEDYLPREKLDIRITPEYFYPDSIFLEEQNLYDSLIDNGLFHQMANGFLVECPKQGVFAPIYHVTTSMDRGVEKAMATLIRRDGTVEKKALYGEGIERMEQLVDNANDLQRHGVTVLEGQLGANSYTMPYLRGENGTAYFRRLLEEDTEAFLTELDRFAQIVFHSSKEVPYELVDWDTFDPDWQRRKKDDPNKDLWKKAAFSDDNINLGPILSKGYIDLVCLNCFVEKGEFVFIDQEFAFPQIPAYAILYRTISLIYGNVAKYQSILPVNRVYKRYHLDKYLNLWVRFSARFTDDLRKVEELRSYHQKRRATANIIHTNRQRVNYTEAEYNRIFRDIFANTEGKKIYLFGSGVFAERFMVRFGQLVEVAGILDNNEKRWGETFAGCKIIAPKEIEGEDKNQTKVIICIKNFLPVMRQLEQMDIHNYSVFDWNVDYPMPGEVRQNTDEIALCKKYPVGYVAGVFDLFHIGHLNLLRRAKEQCDHLIVGVVSDEQVLENKGTHPAICYEERAQIVAACRYVDQVVKIPMKYGDTDEMYRKYHFDVQFSGSDYEKDPVWLAKRDFLRKHGAEMVFFPYTESTSSTKLKEMIDRKLL